MKKIIIIVLLALAIPAAYVVCHKPQGAVKHILIVTEHNEPGSVGAALVTTLEQAVTDVHGNVSVADVSELGVAFFDAQDAPAQKPSSDAAVTRWSELVKQSNGVLFLVPNYHNGYPAGIKNAIDVLWKEWHNKPVGVVVYSTSSDNNRAVVRSFTNVLHAIKSDPVSPVVTIAPTQQADKQINAMVTKLYKATSERHYFRELYRAVTNFIFVTIIKFMSPKKHRE